MKDYKAISEKQKELILNLKTGFDKFKAGDLSCSEISKLESEIAALESKEEDFRRECRTCKHDVLGATCYFYCDDSYSGYDKK